MAAGMASMASSMIDAAFSAYGDTSATTDPIESNLDGEKPVWVLGKLFQAEDDLEKLKEDIASKLWFTYRRNFPMIGDSGLTSDTGWGCMLRCGQMMLAQALVVYHLGRDWSWKGNETDDTYMNILKSFLDSWDSEYSIQNIAQMGVGEGKQVGEWFGPNTVSQVLRKLVLFDEASNVVVHVAMDNTVVIDDIKTLCKSDRETWDGFSATKMEDDEPVILEDEQMAESHDEQTFDQALNVDQTESSSEPQCLAQDEPMTVSQSQEESVNTSNVESASLSTAEIQDVSQDEPMVETLNKSQDEAICETSAAAENTPTEPLPSSKNSSALEVESNTTAQTKSEEDSAIPPTLPSESPAENISPNCLCEGDSTTSPTPPSTDTNVNPSKWHPLILIIPLRLGLMEINSDYNSSLKAMFTLKQSLGVIGGKPNHAHYFFGFNGDRLLYLDPHTTQENVEHNYNDDVIADDTYHCTAPSFMDFSSLDPSLALGFYCETEEIFDEWTGAIRELVIDRDQRPMFEICDQRPNHWPPFELPRKPAASSHDTESAAVDFDDTTYDYGEEDQIFDSSGEYEII